MAFTFSNVTGLDHGTLLDIVFTKGVRDQISQDFAEFKLVQSIRNKEATPRALTYKVMTHRGPSRVQYMNPGSATEAMPSGQKVGISEATAYFKELTSAVVVDANLIQRLNATQAKAADELAMEMDASVLDIRRQICKDFYGDGTGLVVRAKSVAVTSGSGAGVDKVVVTVANPSETVDSLAVYGSITFLEEGQILTLASKAGVAVNPILVGTLLGYRVSNIDVDAGTFTIKPVNAAGAELAITSNAESTPIAAGTCCYNLSQVGVCPDLTASISDYGTVSKSIVGIESLSAHDARVVNGLTMSGLFAGSRKDCGGDLITIDDIQSALSIAKRRVGQSAASWNNILMHDKTWDVFVMSIEDDRRFYADDNGSRGSRSFKFVHGKDNLEFIVSEFCPINRAFALPSALKGGPAVQFHMTDMVSQKSPDGGTPWHRVPGSTAGTLTKQFIAWETGFMQMIASQPAAIVALENFTLS